MIKLNFVIICDNAYINEKTGSLNVEGIFTRILADKLPAIHPKFMIVTNVSGDVKDYNQLIVIKNKKTGDKLVELKGELKIKKPKQKAQFLGTFYNIEFKEEGEYEVEVHIDGNKQELCTNFYVKKNK